MANNFIDNIDSFLWKNIFQMSDFWRDSVKRKGLTTKTNRINSAKHDSDSDDSFDIFSENQQSNNKLDLEGLQKWRNQYCSSLLIGYLNINFLQHKIDSLREILKKSSLEIICVDETKLDEGFPESQCKIDGYQFPPFRRDRDKHGGGKVVYIKEGVMVNRIKEFETNRSETICLELTISNKKWFIIYAYRSPNETNKKVFFDELNETMKRWTSMIISF